MTGTGREREFAAFNPARKQEAGKQRFCKRGEIVNRVYCGFDVSGFDNRIAQRISKSPAALSISEWIFDIRCVLPELRPIGPPKEPASTGSGSFFCGTISRAWRWKTE